MFAFEDYDASRAFAKIYTFLYETMLYWASNVIP